MLAVAALLWSTGGLLVKLIVWPPLAIAGMRSAVAALTILLAARRPPRFTWSFAQVGGALGYAATVTLFVIATKSTTAANAVLLQYTAPVYVAVFGYRFLRERSSRFDWLIIAAALGGMALFSLDSLEFGSFWGNACGALSGLAFGGFILCMRKQKDASPLDTVLLGNILTAAVCLPFMFESAPGAVSWLGLVLLGVCQLGIPYMLYAAAVKSVTALEAALVPVLEPLLNPVWVFLFIGETPGPWAVFGGVLLLGSVTIYSAAKAAARKPGVPGTVT